MHLLSCLPGRLRVHLPHWPDGQAGLIEARLRQVPGVQEAKANPLTGNVLVHFDSRSVGAAVVLAALRPWSEPKSDSEGENTGRETPLTPLLRVGVRGLLGHAVVDTFWFGAGFLGKTVGLPLAWLGPLHVLMDMAVWGLALRSGTAPDRPLATGTQPMPASH
jgi:copper chaperone CopZ